MVNIGILSQITENRKVEARKSLIFRHTIFTFGLKNATLRQNRTPPHNPKNRRHRPLILFSPPGHGLATAGCSSEALDMTAYERNR